MRRAVRTAKIVGKKQVHYLSTSGYIGSETTHHGGCQVSVHNQRIHGGSFVDEKEAAKQYDRLVFFHFGPEARHNNLLTSQEIAVALVTNPLPPSKKRDLPRGISRHQKKFRVHVANLEGKCEYHGTYDTRREQEQTNFGNTWLKSVRDCIKLDRSNEIATDKPSFEQLPPEEHPERFRLTPRFGMSSCETHGTGQERSASTQRAK
jgi:hypothetical protein